jgi:CheY-like chemotaxis protein
VLSVCAFDRRHVDCMRLFQQNRIETPRIGNRIMHKSCVLLAEDDQNEVYLFQHAYEEANITAPLHIVRDGQEAIEYLSGTGRFADRSAYPIPTLIVTDFRMPRKNGIELLQWVRAQPGFRSLPVIMHSSSAYGADVELAYMSGVNAFIVKAAFMDLRITLANTIKDFWLGMNCPPMICSEGVERARDFSVRHAVEAHVTF